MYRSAIAPEIPVPLRRRLSRFCERRCPGWGEDLAGDALLRYLRTYRPRHGCPAVHLWWCARKAVHVHRRKAAHRPETVRLDRDLPEIPSSLPVETRVWLDQALGELPPQHARAFLLVELGGLDLREAGAELGVSHESARRYVAAARFALRELL